jgi:excisionase family DNA binding protein
MSTDLIEGVTTPEPNPLTLREAAELLGLHPRAVSEYVRRGELIGDVVRKRWQFRQEDIDTFIEAGREGWDFDRSVDGEG